MNLNVLKYKLRQIKIQYYLLKQKLRVIKAKTIQFLKDWW